MKQIVFIVTENINYFVNYVRYLKVLSLASKCVDFFFLNFKNGGVNFGEEFYGESEIKNF